MNTAQNNDIVPIYRGETNTTGISIKIFSNQDTVLIKCKKKAFTEVRTLDLTLTKRML